MCVCVCACVRVQVLQAGCMTWAALLQQIAKECAYGDSEFIKDLEPLSFTDRAMVLERRLQLGEEHFLRLHSDTQARVATAGSAPQNLPAMSPELKRVQSAVVSETPPPVASSKVGGPAKRPPAAASSASHSDQEAAHAPPAKAISSPAPKSLASVLCESATALHTPLKEVSGTAAAAAAATGVAGGSSPSTSAHATAAAFTHDDVPLVAAANAAPANGASKLQQRTADLCNSPKFSVVHAILATLPVSDVVTTNYDTCYESAYNSRQSLWYDADPVNANRFLV